MKLIRSAYILVVFFAQYTRCAMWIKFYGAIYVSRAKGVILNWLTEY